MQQQWLRISPLVGAGLVRGQSFFFFFFFGCGRGKDIDATRVSGLDAQLDDVSFFAGSRLNS